MKNYSFIILLFMLEIIYSQTIILNELPSVFYRIDLPSCGITLSHSNASEQIYSLDPYPEHTPIKRIRIAFHIFQKSDGTDNFQNTQADIDFLKLLIDSCNHRLSNITPHDPSNTPYINDARYRFVLNYISFYQNDSLSDSRIKYLGGIDHDVFIHKEIIMKRNDLSIVQKENTLHYIIVREGSGGFASDVRNKNYTYVKGGYYNSYQIANPFEQKLWEIFPHMIHETGHNLGLWHTFNPNQIMTCLYIADTCATNNYMSYRTCPGYTPADAKTRNSFASCQLAIMHRVMENNEGNVADIIIQDYCNYNPSESVTIQSNEQITWRGHKRMHGDVIINGQLNFTCNISIPQNGRIIVNPGGVFTIKGGSDVATLKNYCGQSWGGIEVKNNGTLILDSVPWVDYPIVVRNGGTLIVRENTEILVKDNGIIDVEGSLCVGYGSGFFLHGILNPLNLHTGFSLGNNNPGIPADCLWMLSAIETVNGSSGTINVFLQNEYFQNETISNQHYIFGKKVYAGTSVTTSKQYGPAIIGAGGDVIIDADEGVEFQPGFEVQLGGQLQTR